MNSESARRNRTSAYPERAEIGNVRKPPDAKLVWTVEASSHFEAMTLYWEHMGWGEYTTGYQEGNRQTYAERGWE